MSGVLDYSFARPNPWGLKALGFPNVVRYAGAYRNDGAQLTAAEYQALKAAGIAVGIVVEYAVDWTLQGYAYGHAIGLANRDYERSIGVPDGCSYLAVDYDITRGGPPTSPGALGDCSRSLDCFHGFADARGGWHMVRPYGSKWFCEWACQHSPMQASWSAQAWSWVGGQGFMPASNAALYQHASWPAGVPYVAGCDYNDLRGAWAPRGVTPVPGPTPPIPIVHGGDIVAAFRRIDLSKSHDFASAPMRLLRGALEAWGVSVDGRRVTVDDTNSDRTRRGMQFFEAAMAKLGVPVDGYPIVDHKTYNALFAAFEK